MENLKTFQKLWLMIKLLIIVVLTVFVVADASQQALGPTQSIFVLGDSISDTGNAIRLPLLGIVVPSTRRPYGITFPGNPTGRFSDGRLPIDYIATAIGVPLLNPYLDNHASFNNGVNFAVAGSTALDNSFYLTRGILTNGVPALRVQLRWFRQYLSSNICSTRRECVDNLSGAVVFVGEIGYNDIGYPYVARKSVQEIRTYLPLVTQTIINTTREVILSGASKVVVPGNFPLGCFPRFLSVAPTKDSTAYDDLNCLKSLNNLTSYQNNYLQQSLVPLRNEFPNVVILYADYYNAFLTILREASTFGFDTRNLLKACCGVEGQYDLLSPGACGNVGAPICPNPNLYIHWDGVHLTQEAYRRISEILIRNLGITSTI